MNPIDLIPGAQQAYNYVLGKLAAFYVLGTQQIPAWASGASVVEQRATTNGLTSLANQARATRGQVATLGGSWQSLSSRLQDVKDAIYGPSGATVNQASVLSAAKLGAIIVAAGLLGAFFIGSSATEKLVQKMVNDAVSSGVMTPEEAARILRGGGIGGALGSLSNTVIVVALVGAAVYFLPRRRVG